MKGQNEDARTRATAGKAAVAYTDKAMGCIDLTGGGRGESAPSTLTLLLPGVPCNCRRPIKILGYNKRLQIVKHRYRHAPADALTALQQSHAGHAAALLFL